MHHTHLGITWGQPTPSLGYIIKWRFGPEACTAAHLQPKGRSSQRVPPFPSLPVREHGVTRHRGRSVDGEFLQWLKDGMVGAQAHPFGPFFQAFDPPSTRVRWFPRDQRPSPPNTASNSPRQGLPGVGKQAAGGVSLRRGARQNPALGCCAPADAADSGAIFTCTVCTGHPPSTYPPTRHWQAQGPSFHLDPTRVWRAHSNHAAGLNVSKLPAGLRHPITMHGVQPGQARG